MSSDVVRATALVVEALESVGAAYRIGGSIASSALGVPRSTIDVDIVCVLTTAQVDGFVGQLAPNYYVDADMIRDAIRQRASFNVVHLETMTKVDVFIRKDGPYDLEVFRRGTSKSLEEGTRELLLTSAEDIVLRKLEWYRLGNEISERQWLDVLGVLRVQGTAVDVAYMRKWAPALGVSELLERALAATAS